MAVASNTFKKGRKVYTKSGKPEQVLTLASGANVSVNNKELKILTNNSLKENTVGHVQVALGIPGKRNNLKGQGAKNITSFDTGAGGDDSSPDDDADNASESPAGGVGMGGSGGSMAGNGSVSPFAGGTDPDGFGIGSTPTPTPSDPGQDDPEDTSYSSIPGAKSGLTGSNLGAIQSAINEQEEIEEIEAGRWTNIEDKEKSTRPSIEDEVPGRWTDNPVSATIDKGLKASAEEFEEYENKGVNIGLAEVGTSIIANAIGGVPAFIGGKIAGWAIDELAGTKGFFSKSELEPTDKTGIRARAGTPTGLGGKGLGGEEVDAPIADPEPESGATYKPPKIVRQASNNVDLAAPMDEAKYTRDQIRGARRNITRFA